VSYGLRIAGDAIADLRALEPWLQEEVLDELEWLAAAPAQLRVDRSGRAVQDFERTASGKRHVIFLRLHRDAQAQIITLVAVADAVRAAEV
jgi:hypothetical protein